MRPLMEILEDERAIVLKLDTIEQNMKRYGGRDAQDILITRKENAELDLRNIRSEIREYLEDLFNE